MSGSISDATGNSENFSMAADVACSPERIWWLVAMGCGREGGGSWAEVPGLGLVGCSWRSRTLPCFFTTQLEINKHFFVCVVAPNIHPLPFNPAALPDFQVCGSELIFSALTGVILPAAVTDPACHLFLLAFEPWPQLPPWLEKVMWSPS